ncbi:hypothetical protein SteCoe_18062 [Stentor coeruleus]|uniref:C2H2-type domain-containing protein n=1 Tax=Stentor coeruleus TaxID=5963 RepID=A0A1R2BXE8_9CILI|nr:hypothetical protein SteCoe_18062 [Stentor coeruleus]
MNTSYQSQQCSICQICFKQLSSKQNLKQHMNIHTGDKPYKCMHPGCQNSYRHASQLSNHRLLHQEVNLKAKPEFDDFKAFIELVILAIEGNGKREFQIPEGPYNREDSYLPPISGPQNEVKLPWISEA